MSKLGKLGAVAAVAVVAAVLTPSSYADDERLLPDLRQAAVGCPGGYAGDPSQCADWDVCAVRDANLPNGECVTSGRIGAVRLRFTTAEDNIGEGPLLLYGERQNVGQSTMQVRQAFQNRADKSIPLQFSEAQRTTSTSMYYEPAKMHQHWHLTKFEHFELKVPGGDIVATDRKNGFCLGDRYTTYDAAKLPNTVGDGDNPEDWLSIRLENNMCKMLDPAALTVTEGISVGRGDVYLYNVDFQWLDISRVPSGVYDVVNTVNADHTLLEKDYTNNSSSIAINIQWPGGTRQAPTTITKPPQVTLLRSCPGNARCALTPSR